MFEGLADLNYQRRQLDTSISYYKESLSQLKQRGAHHTVHKQIVSKLATALEIQRAGVVKAVSYKNREPVLIHQNQVGPSDSMKASILLNFLKVTGHYW